MEFFFDKDISISSHKFRKVAQENIKKNQIIKQFKAAKLPIMHSKTHIIPVLVRDPILCKQISDILLDKYKIYVQPINYPTVARGAERLRFTPTPLHSDKDIQFLVSAMSDIWADLGLQSY